ncbi:hypothetical protein ACHWQZ_G015029 [Mnemiopsis leidyi]
MIILYILSLVLLQVQQTVPTTVAEQNIFINFGGCNCRPGWVCPDGRSSITYHSHILTFQNIYILRGKRNRLCTKFPETWRSFVHFSAQNKYCISNMKNGTYSYEIVLGDCRFNTFSVLTVNGEVTLSHYQTNYTPRMFSGEVKVTNGTLCFWDPRSPLANKNSILEVVDGCGYPQPTRVSVIKIVLIKEDRPKFTRPTACPCVHGQCKTSVSSGKVTMKCVCEEGWLGEKCDKQCDCKHKCVHGECKTQLKDNKNVNVCCCKAGWYGDFCTDRCKDDKMCVHGTCVENEKTDSKSCKCEEGWSGDLCDTATAVIVREERVWVKVGCKKVCLTLRKEGGEWRYYRYDKQDDKLEPFQPPPGFKWQVHLDGETIIISDSDPVRTHKVNVRVKGKLETILLKLEHGKWNWYVRGSKGGWQDFHPPPGFSLTVKIGNDIIRIKPEATYHKIKMYEGREEKVIYMMRVGNKWVPFSHHNSALRSYHPPSDHSVLVTIGDEHVHIKHSKPCTKNPCQNSGKCTDEGISFSCSCQPEWSGTTCEEKRKEPACKADTCGEHGKCVELQSGLVQCHCHRGWSGFRCNIPSSCPPLSCSNGGIMVTLNGEEHCQCPEGFSGKCCQKQVSICSRDPCNRRGLCEQVGVNFACHCHAPYSGRFCEIERKAVACKVADQIFSVGQVISQHCNRCVCLESGHLVCTKRVCRAEHFIAPTNVKQIVFEGHMCGVSPCVYGRCSSVHYQPRCRCHAGYSGPTCETVVTVTQLSPDYREVTPYRPVVVQHQREVVVEQHHHHHHHHPVTLEEHHHHHPVRVEEHHHVVREIYQRPTIIHQPPPTYHNVEVHNHHHEAQIIQQRTIHQHSACSRVGCGQGSCNVIRSRPHCICRRGWQGSSCQHRIERDTEVSSPCSRHRCHNGGSCIVRSNSASCLCPAQFSGAVCQTDVGYHWSLR